MEHTILPLAMYVALNPIFCCFPPPLPALKRTHMSLSGTLTFTILEMPQSTAVVLEPRGCTLYCNGPELTATLSFESHLMPNSS